MLVHENLCEGDFLNLQRVFTVKRLNQTQTAVVQ